jgi:hypothetical protein
MSYTKQDYERDLQIVGGAPYGSSHFDNCYYTYKENITPNFIIYEWYEWKDKKSSFIKTNIAGLSNIRSLQDIRNCIAMYEANQKYKELISHVPEYYPDEWTDCRCTFCNEPDGDHLDDCKRYLFKELTNEHE